MKVNWLTCEMGNCWQQCYYSMYHQQCDVILYYFLIDLWDCWTQLMYWLTWHIIWWTILGQIWCAGWWHGIVSAGHDSFWKVGYPGVCNAWNFVLESRCWFPPHERHLFKTTKYKKDMYMFYDVCPVWITNFLRLCIWLAISVCVQIASLIEPNDF